MVVCVSRIPAVFTIDGAETYGTASWDYLYMIKGCDNVPQPFIAFTYGRTHRLYSAAHSRHHCFLQSIALHEQIAQPCDIRKKQWKLIRCRKHDYVIKSAYRRAEKSGPPQAL